MRKLYYLAYDKSEQGLYVSIAKSNDFKIVIVDSGWINELLAKKYTYPIGCITGGQQLTGGELGKLRRLIKEKV